MYLYYEINICWIFERFQSEGNCIARVRLAHGLPQRNPVLHHAIRPHHGLPHLHVMTPRKCVGIARANCIYTVCLNHNRLLVNR